LVLKAENITLTSSVENKGAAKPFAITETRIMIINNILGLIKPHWRYSSALLLMFASALSHADCSLKALPTTIQAESYCDMSGMAVEGTSDQDWGQNMGYIDRGDWLSYVVRVPATGTYKVSYRVASKNGGALQIEGSEGAVVHGSIDIPNTDGWQKWKTISHNITLNSGDQQLGIYALQGGWNINWFSLSQINDGGNAEGSRIQAEDYSSMSGVGVEGTSDSGGGKNVAWIDSGDWLAYSNAANIPRAGTYTITYRVASPWGASFSADLFGGKVKLGDVKVPATGGWQQWKTISHSVHLPAGPIDFGIFAKQSWWNLNWISISAGGGSATPPPEETKPAIKAMSLNVYGWKAMPSGAGAFANLIHSRDVDVVGIQEGVGDWRIVTHFPTDYSKAEQLSAALGGCWERRYQIFINRCKGNRFQSNRRFDMTDGPNATRTGESAVINKDGFLYAAIDIHWDHESGATKIANARETAAEVNSLSHMPVVVVGDFNSGCRGHEVNTMIAEAGMTLIGDAGIDCIVTKGFTGTSQTFNASPSDHPGLDASLKP